MPIALGAYWDYETEAHEKISVDCSARFEDPAGAWFELRSRPAFVVVERWSLHADGIYYRRIQSPHPAERVLGPQVRLLALPAGIDARWRDLQSAAQVELEGIGERIETPAGVFETACVVVRHEADDPSAVTRLWIARGVGVVKRVDGSGPTAKTLVLTRYELADAPVPPDLAAAVGRFLATDATSKALGPPSSIVPLRDAGFRMHLPRSRFCRAVWPTTSMLLHECGGAVDRIDPLRAEDWTRMLAAAGIRLTQSTRDEATGKVTVAKSEYSLAHHVAMELIKLVQPAHGDFGLLRPSGTRSQYGEHNGGVHASLGGDVGASHWKFVLEGDLDGMRVLSVTQGPALGPEAMALPLRR